MPLFDLMLENLNVRRGGSVRMLKRILAHSWRASMALDRRWNMRVG